MAAPQIYTAKTLILNEKNEILVLWSGKWPERPDRSEKPDLPGGIVEPGETFWEGAVREAEEETGIKLSTAALTLLYTETKFSELSHDVVAKCLMVARASTTDVTLSWEHQAYKWLPFEKVLDLEWRPFHRDALEFIARYQLLDRFLH